MNTAYPPATYDAMLDEQMTRSLNIAVPWFLMASWLYYHADTSLLTDGRYDALAKQISENWDTIRHRHKVLIDPAALAQGSLYSLPDADYPHLLVSAACHLAGIKEPAFIERKVYPSLPRARVRVRNPVAA